MSGAYWDNPAGGIPIPGNKCMVWFKKVTYLNEKESERLGRPVYYEKTHIVKKPADITIVYDQPVRPADKLEYPAEWAQWEKTQESRPLGTPIDYWHAISESQKAQLKHIGFLTIESFCQAPDSAANNVGPNFYELRKKAQIFMDQGKDAELIGKVKAENDAMRAELAEMRKMMEQLTRPAESVA